MKITINYRNPPAPEPMTLEEFADMHGLEMVVVERDDDCAPESRFYALFKGSWVKRNGMLFGGHGHGATPEAAIWEYARGILGKSIVTGAFTDDRREMRCPMEWRPSSNRDFAQSVQGEQE